MARDGDEMTAFEMSNTRLATEVECQRLGLD
jgi:hypothetical protein